MSYPGYGPPSFHSGGGAGDAQSLRNMIAQHGYGQMTEQVARDIETCRVNYPSLKVEVSSPPEGSGQMTPMLALNGTIPVTYKGNNYNIPISLKLPLGYPHKAPMAYVTPTANMIIRPGQHVDVKGRVYHPILAYWGQTGESAPHAVGKLVALVGVMRSVFGQVTPLYAKTAGGPPNSANASGMPSTPSPPNYPPSNYPPPNGLVSPYPPNGQGNNAPGYGNSASPYPPSNYQQQPPSFYSQQNSHNSSSSVVGAAAAYHSPNNHQQFSQQDEDRIRMESLRSAVLERSRSQIETLSKMCSSEVEALLVDNKLLIESDVAIRAGVERIKSEVASLETAIKLGVETKEDLVKSIEQLRAADEALSSPKSNTAAVDDLIKVQGSAAAQLYQLTARDLALDDTIYVLGRQFWQGRQQHPQSESSSTSSSSKDDLIYFMKCIRSLARDQFMTRALICKIQKCS